ncbi:MAG: hypothetical protein AAGB24_14385 [Bacteroidota bacterium]
MNWKNIAENAINQVLTIGGIIVFSIFVLVPIVKEAISTETTKIENNIDTKMENKFKKIDELNAKIPLLIPVENNQQLGQGCSEDMVCIKKSDLTRGQKRKYGIK